MRKGILREDGTPVSQLIEEWSVEDIIGLVLQKGHKKVVPREFPGGPVYQACSRHSLKVNFLPFSLSFISICMPFCCLTPFKTGGVS